MTEHSRGARSGALTRALYAGILVGLPFLLLSACSGSKDAPKVPLAAGSATAAADSSNPHADRLPAAARTALDLGNAQYRAGKYAEALKSYRDAAAASPGEPSPYFGIYMVAQKQGNKALADSALKVIQSTSGLNDSTVRDVHASGKIPAKKS